VVSFCQESDQLARVEVSGVPRNINIGLVLHDGVQVGDWILIHMGVAMSVIDQAQAEVAMEGLALLRDGTTPPSWA
jgi:hydrogenase expression/formation protein HypC